MSKHTPGPWRVAVWNVYAKSENPVARASSVGDARLIAAAPDMLEALEELVGTLDDGDTVWMDVETKRPVTEKARAIIAKATGVAPEDVERLPRIGVDE